MLIKPLSGILVVLILSFLSTGYAYSQASGGGKILPGITSDVQESPTATAKPPAQADTSVQSSGTAKSADAAATKREPLIPFDPKDFDKTWLTRDTNGDGRIDYAVKMDGQDRKQLEALDYNHDGRMDDFVYYSNGVPVREEIDSNYDGKIDLWVYLYQGVYIERYEQDTNFDGIPDIVRNYGKKK
jgi:hypothetical protein